MLLAGRRRVRHAKRGEGPYSRIQPAWPVVASWGRHSSRYGTMRKGAGAANKLGAGEESLLGASTMTSQTTGEATSGSRWEA